MSRPVVLASSSPRRRQLLDEHGIPHAAIAPPIDDGELAPGDTDPRSWVVALAHLKARSVADHNTGGALVLGSDTVVVKGDAIIGQPRDRDHAREIIRRLAGGAHAVLTGVAIIDAQTSERHHFVDASDVTVGAIDEGAINAYLDSNDWQGKAGAYNLMDRINAGWPIRYEGDPTTVMGLPMRRLGPLLRALGAEAPEPV